MRTIEDFVNLEPMKYYNNETNIQKRLDMIENKDNLYIATEKHDGDWSMCIHFTSGHNLIRSRSISKVTGRYGDYTAKLPHLCAEMDEWPDNTVVLAEICWDEYGTNANTVGTILRCLPAKAVERQKSKKLSGYIFDILMMDDADCSDLPYEQRLRVAKGLVSHLASNEARRFKLTKVFDQDFAGAADAIIAVGGEGVVIQKRENPYMPGTRTAWATLKLKQSLAHMDVPVVDLLDPKRNYEGDLAESWPYKLADGTLVTKPYFMGWKNGITVRLPSGVTCDVTSGLTDDDRAFLASDEASARVAANELWAEVKAMSINDKGALRHPVLVRLRTDLDSRGE